MFSTPFILIDLAKPQKNLGVTNAFEINSEASKVIGYARFET